MSPVHSIHDLDHNTESLGIIGVFNRHAEQTIRSLLGDDMAVTSLEDGGIQSVESAHKVGVTYHGLPYPIVVFVTNKPSVNLCQLCYGVGNGWQSTSVFGNPKG